MSNRTQLVLILACVAAALAFVGIQVFRAAGTRSYAPDATFSERARLADFASNGVRVVVAIDSDSQGQPVLRGTFTPIDREFHLYSKDLNPKTSGGAGVATRLELLPHSLVRVAGRPFSDVASQTHRDKDANVTVDVYPDGPVSLRLPIQFVGAPTNIATQVAVSYMACKTDGECRQPVDRQILDVSIVSR